MSRKRGTRAKVGSWKMGITVPGPETSWPRTRRKVALAPCLLRAFLRLQERSPRDPPNQGEGAKWSGSRAQFLNLAPPPPAPSFCRLPTSAHLVQAVSAQVTHGLLNALRQWLAGALHVDEGWHPKHMLAPVVWGLVPFHELWHRPV